MPFAQPGDLVVTRATVTAGGARRCDRYWRPLFLYGNRDVETGWEGWCLVCNWMWRYGELKQIIQFKLLDWLPDANTRRHIWSYLASDRDIDLFLCGSAQLQLHNLQVNAVHRVWQTLLLGKWPTVYVGNRIRQLHDDDASDLESEDGILSAYHNYTNLFWKTQLSKNAVYDTYENRPLAIIIRFLGKPPFPEAPRRQFAHQSLSPAQIVANAVQRRSASAESSRECKRRRSAEPIRQQTSDHHHSASSE